MKKQFADTWLAVFLVWLVFWCLPWCAMFAYGLHRHGRWPFN